MSEGDTAEDTTDAFKLSKLLGACAKPAADDNEPLPPPVPAHSNIDNSVVKRSEFESPYLAYNMNYENRGLCILINEKLFDRERTGQSTREGSDMDAVNVEKTFRRLGFQVRRFDNVNVRELQAVLVDASKCDHSKADCFAFVITTHGGNGYIYAKDGRIQVDTILSYFKGDRCKSLIGKPKLFFIQACRGTQFDEGVHVTDGISDDELMITRIPVEADILVAYSTTPGFFAWRNAAAGSWFMQTLCKMLDGHASKSGGANTQPEIDLVTLLTTVCRIVAYEYESNTNEKGSHAMKQMPSVVSTLTKLVYFKPKSRR